MDTADKLAMLNAMLNGTALAFLVAGFAFIKAGKRKAHARAMLGAFGISAVFLVSYLTRVAMSGTHTYPEDAAGRTVYLVMLASHVLLATTVPVFALRGIALARAERFDEHKRWMRIGLPIWAYVSVTGVAIFVMLYGALGKL